MKPLVIFVLGPIVFGLFPIVAIVQGGIETAVLITVEASVRDPHGRPVEGATVHLSLPRYRLGETNQDVEAKTDEEGVATVSGYAQQDYGLSVDKVGYYPTRGTHRVINDVRSLGENTAGVQRVEMELRPVLDPIIGIAREVDRRLLPRTDGTSMGFDLEVGDWVAPYGNGNVSDFIFTVGEYFGSVNDYDQSLILSFSNVGDGVIAFRRPKTLGSVLKWPYEAPLDGYTSQRVWHKSFDGIRRATKVDNSGETNYLFRIRTELDEGGNVRRALYGVIANDIVIGGNNDIGRYVSFTYALNPDRTRNLEFDPAKTATSPR